MLLQLGPHKAMLANQAGGVSIVPYN